MNLRGECCQISATGGRPSQTKSEWWRIVGRSGGSGLTRCAGRGRDISSTWRSGADDAVPKTTFRAHRSRTSSLPPNPRSTTVFDCGAFQCLIAMILDKFVGAAGKVVAVEAGSRNYEAAIRNCRLNEASNVAVIHRNLPHSNSRINSTFCIGIIKLCSN